MSDVALLAEAFEVAHRAADAAARVHRGYAGALHEIDTKSSVTDLVTEVDRLAEDAIRREIAAAFPEHAVWGEEAGASTGDARHRWIVDPLDGTVNYAHGLPIYATSIALEVDAIVELGVVLDTARGERFAARRGGGATRDGVPVRVSQTRELRAAMLATGFAYAGPAIERNLAAFARAVPAARAVRRPGAAALDLCHVACGRFDGFWELDLKPWDVAAGALLIVEAGGTVTNVHGAPYRWSDDGLVATNGHLHGHLLGLLGWADARA